MIYFRKFVDMFILSVIPSLVSFLAMWRFMGYNVWLIGCIASTLIFFVGNVLLIRRFVRDIKSKARYYRVWLLTFAVYTFLGALCLIQDWMYPFTWLFFHSRLLSILTIPSGNEIPVWVSFMISMIVYLVIILTAYPNFYKSFQKEIEHHKHIQEQDKEYRHEIREKAEKRGDRRTHIVDIDDDAKTLLQTQKNKPEDNTLYSRRQYNRMRKRGQLEVRTGGRIGRSKKDEGRIINMIMSAVYNIGSYGFYQAVYDKQEMGIDTKPLVRNYIRRKLHLGISTRPNVPRYRARKK